jgi:stearoyl-CoA desaturase (Delta-9 desaturase)
MVACRTLVPALTDPSGAWSPPVSAGALQKFSARVLIGLPLAGLVWAMAWVLGRWREPDRLAIAAGMYLLTGHGLAVGFHRMFTHRSFRPTRPLKSP